MKPKKNVRDIDRTFIQYVMLNLGILPIENPKHDMRRGLRQLPPEEARVMKRKFRKLWRKMMRAQLNDGNHRRLQRENIKTKFGVGKRVPSRNASTARKILVFTQLWESHIEPMIMNFENILDRSSEMNNR